MSSRIYDRPTQMVAGGPHVAQKKPQSSPAKKAVKNLGKHVV